MHLVEVLVEPASEGLRVAPLDQIRELAVMVQDGLGALMGEFRGLVELELRALYPDENDLLRELVRSEPALARLRDASRRGGYPSL